MKVISTKKVTVPNYAGTEVVMLEKAPWGAYEEIQPGMTEIQMAVKILPKVIVSWNFDDENDKPLEVTQDTIRRLPKDIVIHLLEEAVNHKPLKKKTSGESPA